ncbi:MAG: hypothetical protein ACK4SM_05825 [Aquificaceae bacterium]
MNKVFLSLYTGSLFFLLLVVAPVLLRYGENKNLAGRFYGKILWRFYPIAFLLLLLYHIYDGKNFYSLYLMVGLGVNVVISYWLKTYKKSIEDIDQIPYGDKKRVLFRRVSFLSTFVLFINFLLSLGLLYLS